MRMFEIGKRLGMCASFVRQGARIADVGTDHAFLPIWLVAKGVSPCAVATDINELPAQKARANIKKYKMDDKVTAFTCDGLEKVSPEDVDDIIIAGMGGEVIWGIIDRAKWLCDKKYRLILQPMSRADNLREGLLSAGFVIIDEQPVCEGDRLYTVICAEYAPDGVQYAPSDIYFGGLRGKTDSLSRRYFARQARLLASRVKGLEKGSREEAQLLAIIDELEKAAEE